MDRLVGQPLILCRARLGGEQIRRDVGVVRRKIQRSPWRSPCRRCRATSPQHGSRQRNGDAITASLECPPPQGRKNADRAEPAHGVVANGDDWRRFRLRGRAFDAEQPVTAAPTSSNPGRFFQGPCRREGRHEHGSAWLLCAELSASSRWPPGSRTFVGEEDVASFSRRSNVARSSLEEIQMVERIPTCTSQAKPSTSVSLGRQMLRTSAPCKARSLPIAAPAINMPHSQCTDAVQWALSTLLEGDRLASLRSSPRDQKHPGNHVDVLRFLRNSS
jgi:hypothetical protein